MATAAFRSTTRRTSISDSDSISNSNSSSSIQQHRSRSVSRFSHRNTEDDAAREPEEPSSVRRGKSEFPEISLDDLAIELLSMSSASEVSSVKHANDDELNRRGRSVASNSDTAALRRGRSVSRRGSRVSDLRHNSNTNHNNNSVVDNKNIKSKSEFGDKNGGMSGRRRSLSLAPKSSLVSDSEKEHLPKNRSRFDPVHVSVWDRQKPSVHKYSASNQQKGLRKCNSQKDLFQSYDSFSSYSSTLTDDEAKDPCYDVSGIEKADYSLYKGSLVSNLDQSSRWCRALDKKKIQSFKDKELDSVQPDDEKKVLDLEDHGLQPEGSDIFETIGTIRRKYNTKLEESEKRKEELLTEIMLEEKHGKELKKVLGELNPNAKKTSPTRRPMQRRKRSTDKTKVAKHLVEDADRIIDDFISSVEETNNSSFDGDQSDTSSFFEGTFKPMVQYGGIESNKSPLRSDFLPDVMDGVVLPWLKWEAGTDETLLLGIEKKRPATPKNVLQHALEETAGGAPQERSVNSSSSSGSWSPGAANSFCASLGETRRIGEAEDCKNHLLSQVPRKYRMDIDDYQKPPSNENFISEIWRQRKKIDSGGLLICSSGSLGKFLL